MFVKSPSPFRKWCSLWLGLGCFSSVALAAKPTVSQQHFLVGYEAYKEKNYGVCAEQLLQATPLPEAEETRAVLYLAACQVPLGYRGYAAQKIAFLQDRKIAEEDKMLYETMLAELGPELEAINKYYVSLTGYGGSMGYSGGSKTSGAFFGGMAALTHHTWSLRLAGESDQIQLQAPLTPYSQTQVHGDFSKWAFSDSFQLRLGYTSISSSENDLSGISVYSLGALYYFTAKTRIGLRFDYSQYPNSRLGSLNLQEYTASLGQTLWTGNTWSLWGQVLSQTISPSSTQTYDATTKFNLKSSYERVAAQLILSIGSFDIEGNGWGGNEAFGVREDGFIVYNSEEEHQGGFGAALGYRFSPTWSVRLSGSQETFEVSGPAYQATVVGGSLTINF